MKARLHSAPFALTSTGKVVLGVCAFDDSDDLERAVDVARAHGTTIFIGVVLTDRETALALERLASGFSESAAYTAGARQRRVRQARRPGSPASSEAGARRGRRG